MNDILKTQQSFLPGRHKPNRSTDLKTCTISYVVKIGCVWPLAHVLSNRGARTAGIDGVSKHDLQTEEAQLAFIGELQATLKSRTYQPQAVKRVWIDKPGKTEKRGLGIPTIRDRVVQELLRMLMEPIWESDFLDCSHGFRPGRRTMDCIYFFYSRVHTVNKYLWAIEGDIRKCFDRINHQILLRLVSQRIADQRIVTLVKAFLQAGILEDGLFQDTPEYTPGRNLVTPLANIYLHQLDQWWWQKFGKTVS